MDTGIRELRDNLSRYIRRVESGERIAVTAHGRVVAELVPPGQASGPRAQGRLAALVASGAIRPPRIRARRSSGPTSGSPKERPRR